MHCLGSIVVVFCAVSTLCGCGLYEEIPEYAGADGHGALRDSPDASGDAAPVSSRECTVSEDCASRENMGAQCRDFRCVYTCEPGFVDADRQASTNGCECAVTREVCDGLDNDCDGFVDNIFKDGQLAVGGRHSCAADATGVLYCWGANEHGQLGLGSTEGHTEPTRALISNQLRVTHLGVGENHSCVLGEDDASLHCWGANAHGQLGDGSTEARLSPSSPIAFSQTPIRIAAGSAHTCVLDSAQRLHCWGDNRTGQLGVGSSEDTITTPMPAMEDLSFESVAAGERHTCGLMRDGRIYCWGDNSQGQLGVGDFDAHLGRTQPTAMPETAKFSALAAAGSYTCGLLSAGRVYCWGGGIGLPHAVSDPQGTPIDFAGATISLGANAQFCALNTQEDTLLCGSIDSPGLSTHHDGYLFKTLAAGFGHTCALNEHGRVYCWGDNAAGQVGNGTPGGTVPSPLVAVCR